MRFLKVKKSQNLTGTISMPASKTHSFRALVLGALADGTSVIREPKLSPDWDEGVKAMKMYGAKIEEIEKNVFQIKGVAGKLQTPEDVINVNNSGTMLAFIVGIAAACEGWSIITGDESIRTLRKVSKNLFKPFEELGVKIISTKNDGMAPLIIRGKVNGGVAHMDGTGCQPVFSVLIASALSEKPVEIFVDNPGETAYIDLLLFWFDKVGLKYKNDQHKHYSFPGNKPPKSFDAKIPFEWSAQGYPLLSAIITENSEIKVEGMDLKDPYGDKQVIDILQKMGAHLTIEGNCLTAHSSQLHGIEIDMNKLPDQVPTIAVAACFARGKTVIKNALTARWKECDRITAVCTELKKMGAKITEKEDGLIIHQDGSWKLKGAKVNGYYDHRMVMVFAVAGLASEGETIISDAQMVEKSFDSYIPEMKRAGANYELIEK
ncbi:3-phosphoshikimate 1-carboxyvinyltransferase [Candidatus Roizmanbacteria bacterium CG_4_8_14_3_um_filter_34_9]|uniref:3-phosphoshikimate 1-carboxyvinyltransferase n=2 Tax=Candidatus Roizmaniibacteriota TaxID=1752723 RepID=A0A2M7ATU3_9BACT|nr:MAG: 3-phosphoshikimate 1-carboxyvinyltransferase [Candidatus Roizmanbacteria bacterium CG06_land_8_20_14_3_00_34_14]PIW73573.1 MAG: 3-phosphoshikimate 1-carboxyvinyltransferase [Candidatus Roizmanbacteria bacterium CG_4_8_14_3_um_filter_34_9]